MTLTQDLRLDGRVAVVIGGTGVLGSAMAAALLDAGATVVVAGRGRTNAALGVGGKEPAGFEPCDTTDRSSVASLRDRVLERHGRVDVLVNGAGVNSATPFLQITDAELDQLVAVNQLGVLRACQEFGRYFVDRAERTGEGASIVNVGSASGLTPLSQVFTYSMAKAAVHNLTKNLAREWGPLGIRCNVLVPGFFPAEQNRTVLTPERVQAILGHTPMGRFGEAIELSGAVVLLASDAGSFITGTELIVDGGFSVMTI